MTSKQWILEWVDQLPEPGYRDARNARTKEPQYRMAHLLMELAANPGQWAALGVPKEYGHNIRAYAKNQGLPLEAVVRKGQLYARLALEEK